MRAGAGTVGGGKVGVVALGATVVPRADRGRLHLNERGAGQRAVLLRVRVRRGRVDVVVRVGRVEDAAVVGGACAVRRLVAAELVLER